MVNRTPANLPPPLTTSHFSSSALRFASAHPRLPNPVARFAFVLTCFAIAFARFAFPFAPFAFAVGGGLRLSAVPVSRFHFALAGFWLALARFTFALAFSLSFPYLQSPSHKLYTCRPRRSLCLCPCTLAANARPRGSDLRRNRNFKILKLMKTQILGEEQNSKFGRDQNLCFRNGTKV